MTAPIQGFNAKLGIDTVNPVAVGFDFLSENLILQEEFKDRAGIRGTRSHNVEVMRAGVRRPDGQIRLQPTYTEWTNLLQWILGGTPSGTSPKTYPLGESLQSRYVTIDRSDGTNGKVFTYSGVYVDKATIKGQQDELVELTLDLVGTDEAIGNAGTYPVITLDTAYPFIFSDLTLTANSAVYTAKNVEIVIDNHLDKERFFNSLTRTAILPQDRQITITWNSSYGEAVALYNSGIAGIAVDATFAAGGAGAGAAGVSLDFSFTKVVFPRIAPAVGGKAEEMLPMHGVAKKSGATLEMSVLLDSTP